MAVKNRTCFTVMGTGVLLFRLFGLSCQIPMRRRSPGSRLSTGSFQVNGCLLFLQKCSKYDREGTHVQYWMFYWVHNGLIGFGTGINGRRKGILGLTDDSVLIVQSKGSPVELVLCEVQIAAWTLRAWVWWLKEREMRWWPTGIRGKWWSIPTEFQGSLR